IDRSASIPGPGGLVMVVTGGSGFLGSHLVQVLLEAEPELRELRILDLEPSGPAVPGRRRRFRGSRGRPGRGRRRFPSWPPLKTWCYNNCVLFKEGNNI
uniref:3-beta hydroxysteroid dehydrogenase/isomerase domain-containing protein n=1 Tax=Serinus canaria TaxID=9135 RepID=A0A8C9L4E2_SERCA